MYLNPDDPATACRHTAAVRMPPRADSGGILHRHPPNPKPPVNRGRRVSRVEPADHADAPASTTRRPTDGPGSTKTLNFSIMSSKSNNAMTTTSCKIWATQGARARRALLQNHIPPADNVNVIRQRDKRQAAPCYSGPPPIIHPNQRSSGPVLAI